MALTNAEKQKRFRESKIISLAAPAEEIADRLLAMERHRLVIVMDCINDKLKEPPPVANVPRTKAAAARTLQSDRSFAVEVERSDGTRSGNGVRVGTREQAELYALQVPHQMEKGSYVTIEIVKHNEPPTNCIWYDRYRQTMTSFKEGTCGSLNWRPINRP